MDALRHLRERADDSDSDAQVPQLDILRRGIRQYERHCHGRVAL
jgi:hypothetical protein